MSLGRENRPRPSFEFDDRVLDLEPVVGRPQFHRSEPLSPQEIHAEDAIVVGVWMLQPGEDLIVGRHLREVLLKAVT